MFDGTAVTTEAGQSRLFAWIGRNPLKSPESDEGIQENPNLFALESLPFSLDSFGILWPNLVFLGFLG
jgi:hypothetical protein